MSQARNGAPWVTIVGLETEVLAVSWDARVTVVCVMGLDSRCFQAACCHGLVKWPVKVVAFGGGLGMEVEASSWDERLQYAAGKDGLADAG